MVDLDNFVEAAAYYILQWESFGSRRTLRVQTQMTGSNPFFDGTVQTGPDETLFDRGDDLNHSLMTLVIMHAEDHFGMERMRQNYCVVIVNFLFRFSSATKDPLKVHIQFTFPLFMEVIHDFSDFRILEISIVALLFALPGDAFKVANFEASSQSTPHHVSLLSPFEIGH